MKNDLTNIDGRLAMYEFATEAELNEARETLINNKINELQARIDSLKGALK
jgi:hypothetical protein